MKSYIQQGTENLSKIFQNWSKVGVELEKHLLSTICRVYLLPYTDIVVLYKYTSSGRSLVHTNPGPPDLDPLQNHRGHQGGCSRLEFRIRAFQLVIITGIAPNHWCQI